MVIIEREQRRIATITDRVAADPIYLEFENSLEEGFTTAVTRLIRLGNCPAIKLLVENLLALSGSFNNPDGMLH